MLNSTTTSLMTQTAPIEAPFRRDGRACRELAHAGGAGEDGDRAQDEQSRQHKPVGFGHAQNVRTDRVLAHQQIG
jgi:hypothetical protein